MQVSCNLFQGPFKVKAKYHLYLLEDFKWLICKIILMIFCKGQEFLSVRLYRQLLIIQTWASMNHRQLGVNVKLVLFTSVNTAIGKVETNFTIHHCPYFPNNLYRLVSDTNFKGSLVKSGMIWFSGHQWVA